jgi:hypothetical protein
MKKIYRNSIYTCLGALLCLFTAFSANAQGGIRPSGGGGVSSGGGGGGSAPSAAPAQRPATVSPQPSNNNGGGGISRPSVGYNNTNGDNVGIARPSGPPQRSSVGPQNSGPQRPSFQAGQNNANGQGITGRGPGYMPRQGVIQGNTINNPRLGNYGYAPRVGSTIQTGGVRSTTNYRTIPTIGYGGTGYWGNHGYYHNNHGYYGSYYRPRLGFSIGVLPYGYYPFYFGDYEYFYSAGLFYQYDNSQYTVVEPPIGAQVTTLPDNAQSIVINGQQYYEANGVYYAPYKKDDGTMVYEVAGKDGELNTGSTIQDEPRALQMGDIVAELPQDCRKINVNGQKLYVSPDGVYYQEQVDSNRNKTYKIVGLPADENGQN